MPRRKDAGVEGEHHAVNSADWDVRAKAPRKAIVSFRVPEDEWDALEDSAKGVKESVSDYVRRAIEFRRARKFPTFIQATSGGAQFQIIATPPTVPSFQYRTAPNSVTLKSDYVPGYPCQQNTEVVSAS